LTRGRAFSGRQSLCGDDNDFLNKNVICATHRTVLGVGWRVPTRTCQFPGHQGKVKPTRHLNWQTYQQLLEMHDHVHDVDEGKLPPPVGSCKLFHCTNMIYSYLK
jgi:hypothetical protein